jgi:hypothetical protein
MGEYSKRIGEVGEKVVAEFLNLIGWKDPMRNTDIESIDKEFRKNTNGMDGYFHYVSPMISGTIENVIYSSKYSTEPYPLSQIVAQFKERYYELAKVIESFKKSELKQQTINLYENIDTHFDRGILFWLNNSREGQTDLISRLSKIELDTAGHHDGIFLVDNKRIEFIYDSICYVQLMFKDHDIDFIYFNNGLNNDEKNHRNGKVMPIQSINSSILALRAFKDNKTTVILSSIDNFNKEDLMKYIGIAKNIGCNLQGSTIICFPDYLETQHQPDVSNIKNAFNDSSFTSQLEVVNYNNSILR